ncbi:M23 family metallopeptidase [candidate division KSB1 bacterium]|nr:M23 family metallopeptidase [candidate division KSB1 bacterium]
MPKKFRIVLFSNATSSTKELNFSKFHIFAFACVCLVFIGSITAVSVNILSNYLYAFRLNRLSQERSAMRSDIKELNQSYEELNSRLSMLFNSGGDLRREANLDPLSSSIREAGIGGSESIPSNQSEFFFSESELISDIAIKLNEFKRLVEIQESSFFAIAAGLENQKERLRYFPSVVPINPNEGEIHLTDRFGLRADPVSGAADNHQGIDIRGNIGTPVHATADGKVVVLHKTTNGELGIYVRIDHYSSKYGFVTRYAHLSKINPNLKVGSIVKRWDNIGEIGATGRTTGPHLHYEVIRWNRHVDPEDESWDPKMFKRFYAEPGVNEPG